MFKRGFLMGAVVALSALVASQAYNWISRKTGLRESRIERSFDAQMSADAGMSAFARLYPEDWRLFRSRMIETRMSRDDHASAAHAWLRAFAGRKAAHTAAAPEGALADLISAEAALIRHLRTTDVALCAAYGMTGLSATVKLSPEANRLGEAAFLRMLAAARAGEDEPTQREEPAEEDLRALADAMAQAGVAAPLAAAFFDGTLTSRAPSDQCAASAGFYEALDRLPPTQAAVLYAPALLAMGQPQPPG